MKKTLLVLLFCSFLTASAGAQNWSFGAGAGPFVFGTFVKRTLITGTETGTGRQTTRLSAATRVGIAADLEREIADRWAIRVEGAFTRAPLSIKGRADDGGVELDAARLNVTTVMVPIVFRINPRGAFRLHLMGGPAYAMYNIERRENTTVRTFSGTRSRFGFAAGGGVGWYLSPRFALEGQITDISTSSPFERADVAGGLAQIEIPRPHNLHTTAGIRYRF